MRKLLIWGLVALSLVSAHLLRTEQVMAAEANSALIRLDKMMEHVSPGRVLVTMNPSGSDVEDAVSVVVGDSWTISAVAGAFTTSTTDLPAGVTAWPGISTATNVSGQTITFPSNDLTSGTLYGFYITGGFTTNPPAGNTPAHLWQLQTLTGGTPSSEAEIAIPTLVNDTVVITANVPADPTALEVELTEANNTTNVQEHQQLDYTITYSSTLPYNQTITLRASWSDGTVVEYVPNSATDAYNSTPPVIDLANRTITWTIISLPSNTINETVSFSLITTDAYTGALPINFSVSGEIVSPVSKVSTLDHVYQYSSPPSTITPTVPHSTSTPGGQPTGTPAPAESTPTPTPPPSQIILNQVQMTELQPHSAAYITTFNQDVEVQIQWGTSVSELSQLLTSPFAHRHTISFTNLLPETTYYFRIFATNQTGERYQSDLYTFTTTPENREVSTAYQIQFHSGGVLVASGNTDDQLFFLLPMGSSLESTLFLNDANALSAVTVYGIRADQRSLFLGKLIPSANDTFSGSLTLPSTTSELRLFARIENIYGGFIHLPLAQIQLVEPFTILDATNQRPIERATLIIRRKHPITQLFELFSNPTDLPLITDHNGQVVLYLSAGEYNAEIKADGYHTQTITFTISPDMLNQYPRIFLERSPFYIWEKLRYHLASLSVILNNLHQNIDHFAQSSASLQAIGLSSLLIFAVLTTWSLLLKTQMTLDAIKAALQFQRLFHISALGAKHFFTFGKVIDAKTKRPIAGSTVIITDENTQQTLWTGKTDYKGIFKFSLKQHTPVHITISALNYIAFESVISPQEEKIHSHIFELSDRTPTLEGATEKITFGIKQIVGQLFETFLLLSFLVQLIAFYFFPLWEILPFFIITIFNVGLWIQHTYSAHLHRSYLTK